MVEKESFVVRIGPLLNEALAKQNAQIKEATYDVIDSSYYAAGEILAKKLLS